MGFIDWCEENGHLGLLGLERFLPIRGTNKKGQAEYYTVASTLASCGHEWLTRALEMNARDEAKTTAQVVAKSADFPARLTAIRTAAGLSIPDLARKSGLSDDAIRKWEQGERAPTWDGVQKLAAAIGVPTDAFRSSQ
jgi:DNA-binding transcriptional regulator YiaG